MRKWMMAAACGTALLVISQSIIGSFPPHPSDRSPAGGIRKETRPAGEAAGTSGIWTSLPATAPIARQDDVAGKSPGKEAQRKTTRPDAVAPDTSPHSEFPRSGQPLLRQGEAVRGAALLQDERNESPSLFGLSLGDTVEQVQALLGTPARRDPGPFGYEWLIYNQDPARYLQVGIADGRVVDLYSNAPSAELGNVRIGTAHEALARQHAPEPTLSVLCEGTQIHITNQPEERPLVLVGGTPVIFYLDKQNNSRVTAIRIIGVRQLVVGGYYETRWVAREEGPSFDPPVLTIKQREAVDEALARQLLDLANVVRYRYKLPLLKWNERVAATAKSHSRDMDEGAYFDHVSPRTGLDPFERLKQAGIAYRLAGENIAAGFPDAIEAHESWMNSPGHRKNILEKGFTQLGAGVHADFYTQNFVTPR